MHLVELILDLFASLIGPHFGNNGDNSTAGKSPMEEKMDRFWRTLGIAILLVGIVLIALHYRPK